MCSRIFFLWLIALFICGIIKFCVLKVGRRCIVGVNWEFVRMMVVWDLCFVLGFYSFGVFFFKRVWEWSSNVRIISVGGCKLD